MSLEQTHEDDALLDEDEVEYERMNLFYEDDAELPEVETLYETGDSRQEKADKVVAAVQDYLECKQRIARYFRVLYGLADSEWDTNE